MCTFVWGGDAEQLWICFNRDQPRSRAEAESPEISGEPGSRLAYARDPVGNGTWLAVSERGYLVALLNNYPDERTIQNSDLTSRGQLVLQLARERSATAADRCLKQVDLNAFAPFHLFILSLEESFYHTWNALTLEPLSCCRNFWTSSSYLEEKVVGWRTSFWEKRSMGKSLDATAAGEILQEPFPANPAYGLTMDREDARTVSQIRVEMDSSGFSFYYLGREKDGPGFLEPISLSCHR